MQLIALPGRNEQTDAWLRSLLTDSRLRSEGIVRYRHWDSAIDADADFEAQRLAGLSPDLVIAKSFGTVVAATAFRSHHFRPQRAILIGAPFSALDPGDLVNLRRLAEGAETLFIQQAEDPGGAASQLGGALRLSQANVVIVPGSDHAYKEVTVLADIIRDWIKPA